MFFGYVKDGCNLIKGSKGARHKIFSEKPNELQDFFNMDCYYNESLGRKIRDKKLHFLAQK